MNPDWLLKYFEQISEAPDAVPRLRRLILDLAVRGKLVEQNPRDEPVSELLKRIDAEKEHRENAGGIRNPKLLLPVEDEIAHFEIPKTWKWTHVEDVAHVEMGQSPSSEFYNHHHEGLPFYQGKADFGKIHPTPRYWCTSPTKLAEKGDILISVRAPVGPTNVSTETCCIGRGLAALRSYQGYERDFLLLCLKKFAPDLEALGAGTTFVAINRKHLMTFPVPLPPLAEQHRIVAKVDELMALADELEATQAMRERWRDRLVAATLHGLNNGDDSSEPGGHSTFEENARFYFNHLPHLTTRPEHIHQLCQTILNLAIRGRLVPQDAKDEPVRKVLDRFFLEKQNKWRELQIAKAGGKNHKIKSGSSEKRYDEPITPNVQGLPKLPVAWEWVCWESVLAFGDKSFKRGPFGSSLTKSIFVSSGYKVYEQYCPINDDCSFARYYITPQKYKELQGFAVKAKDFLISCSGVTLGRITQVPDEYEEGIINQALLRVRIESKLISDSFFKMLFRSPYFQNQIFGNSTGMAIPNVKGVKELKAIPLPLPPLAEQHRIVAKVDELMALCDELEARVTTTATTRRQLLEATLHEAVSRGA